MEAFQGPPEMPVGTHFRSGILTKRGQLTKYRQSPISF